MKLNYRTIIFCVLCSSIAQAALAMKMNNQPFASPAHNDTAKVIERGGSITAIDSKNKTLSVDNIVYALPAQPLTIHALPNHKSSEKIFTLKPGMLIKFNTMKDNNSGPQQITEIWVTSLTGHPFLRKK